jgi:hypothetical protein
MKSLAEMTFTSKIPASSLSHDSLIPEMRNSHQACEEGNFHLQSLCTCNPSVHLDRRGSSALFYVVQWYILTGRLSTSNDLSVLRFGANLQHFLHLLPQGKENISHQSCNRSFYSYRTNPRTLAKNCWEALVIPLSDDFSALLCISNSANVCLQPHLQQCFH